jgi:hypothetical protein
MYRHDTAASQAASLLGWPTTESEAGAVSCLPLAKPARDASSRVAYRPECATFAGFD